ncbi:Helicase C-terminal [Penicillium cf. griseofulvum]|nr:Helicase C-terminal [Penicillium cf. griseofulvum]
MMENITTLSTIASTLNHAKEWTEKQTNNGSEKRRANATLIVLPNEDKSKNYVTILKLILTLKVLMDQWLDEIRKYVFQIYQISFAFVNFYTWSVVSCQDFKLKVAMNGFERSSSDESSDDMGTESDVS